jgi:D-arabinose 1-dehydrogenase-like Zn-dependent alcohol dehydrogenase
VVVWHTRAMLLLLLLLLVLQALMEAQPVAGQRALVFAASGGVGHVAVQLAKSLGLTTAGVAGPKNTVRGGTEARHALTSCKPCMAASESRWQGELCVAVVCPAAECHDMSTCTPRQCFNL